MRITQGIAGKVHVHNRSKPGIKQQTHAVLPYKHLLFVEQDQPGPALVSSVR